jgi:hypothetical protein
MPTLFDGNAPDKEIQNHRFLRVAISGDGGNTYSVTEPVLQTSWIIRTNDNFRIEKLQGNGFAAVDLSQGPFRGRVYVVWLETAGDRHDVRVIHSSDNGRTWSKPVSVPDDHGPVDDANPTIAVNNHGVVGVTWNDRRARNDACYDLYFSASLDGGETFLSNVMTGRKPTCPLAPGNWKPSAGISAYPKTDAGVSVEGQGLNVLMISTRFPGGGDTQGLDADSNGVFHAGWIDGSSGVMQIAETSFSVNGDVHQAVAQKRDVSIQVRLVANDCGFDWKSSKFSCRMHLENKSRLPVAGPFTVELQTVRVNLKDFQAENADNHHAAVGAAWDFGSEQLNPGETSKERRFVWHFSGMPTEPEYPFMMFKVVSDKPENNERVAKPKQSMAGQETR